MFRAIRGPKATRKQNTEISTQHHLNNFSPRNYNTNFKFPNPENLNMHKLHFENKKMKQKDLVGLVFTSDNKEQINRKFFVLDHDSKKPHQNFKVQAIEYITNIVETKNWLIPQFNNPEIFSQEGVRGATAIEQATNKIADTQELVNVVQNHDVIDRRSAGFAQGSKKDYIKYLGSYYDDIKKSTLTNDSRVTFHFKNYYSDQSLHVAYPLDLLIAAKKFPNFHAINQSGPQAEVVFWANEIRKELKEEAKIIELYGDKDLFKKFDNALKNKAELEIEKLLSQNDVSKEAIIAHRNLNENRISDEVKFNYACSQKTLALTEMKNISYRSSFFRPINTLATEIKEPVKYTLIGLNLTVGINAFANRLDHLLDFTGLNIESNKMVFYLETCKGFHHDIHRNFISFIALANQFHKEKFGAPIFAIALGPIILEKIDSTEKKQQDIIDEVKNCCNELGIKLFLKHGTSHEANSIIDDVLNNGLLVPYENGKTCVGATSHEFNVFSNENTEIDFKLQNPRHEAALKKICDYSYQVLQESAAR